MRLLVLASVQPSFQHARAGYIVLASLLEALAGLGHQVGFATAGCANRIDASSSERLGAAGVSFVGDYTQDMHVRAGDVTGLRSDVRTLRKAFLPMKNDDDPVFEVPGATVKKLLASKPDLIVLFWDTWFEHLLGHLAAVPVVGYLAKPRYDSPMRAIENSDGTGVGAVKNAIAYRTLAHQRARHLVRLKNLKAACNICALDASAYTDAGIACSYVSNTWPDMFGALWRTRRQAAQLARAETGILGNIGDMTGTGNRYGLHYLATQVLPGLAAGNWRISLCGKAPPAGELAAGLNHPNVLVKGFIDDIDAEMLGNKVLLLLNNAGPYTGGYTRVIYAFSSGACLVGHSKLAESMPEVVHGQNALLGASGPEIAALITRVVNDPDLAARIGANARATYERACRPEVVAGRLVQIAAMT